MWGLKCLIVSASVRDKEFEVYDCVLVRDAALEVRDCLSWKEMWNWECMIVCVHVRDVHLEAYDCVHLGKRCGVGSI